MIFYIQDIDWNIVQEEVNFLNYLVCKNKSIQQDFFNKLCAPKRRDVIITKYLQYFENKNIVFLPKKIHTISFLDKLLLRNPTKAFNLTSKKAQKRIRQYYDLIEIKKTTMTVLDKVLSPIFKDSTTIVQEPIIIFDTPSKNQNRYTQFQYIVEGIGDKKVQWYKHVMLSSKEALVHKLNQVLKNINMKGLKEVAFWYHAGTSALSPN